MQDLEEEQPGVVETLDRTGVRVGTQHHEGRSIGPSNRVVPHDTSN